MGGAKADLITADHDVVWAGDWAEDPGDEEILSRAHREGRVLVTLDKDFGELAIFRQSPHSGILRLVDFAARRQGPAIAQILALRGPELLAGALLTAEPDRL